MENKKKTLRVLSIKCVLSLTLCGLFAFAIRQEVESKHIEVEAALDIESSTGITISSSNTENITATNDWKSKVIVFEVKSSETIVKFQLRSSSGDGGIVGTEAGISSVKYESEQYAVDKTGDYWGSNCYSVSIGDDWYRWVVDLSDYKGVNSMSDQLTRSKCLTGTNVQVRNLKFYDEMYIEPTGLCSSSYGFLTTQIANWASQTVEFDMRLPDDTQRRVQLCKDSGDGLSGLIICTKTALKYENPEGNPYLREYETAPVSLGDDWYHFVLDLSKVKIASGRDGTETLVKIKNIPDTTDNNPSIEIKNFKKYYDPTADAQAVLKTGEKTTLPNITSWSTAKISFEVYHDSLDQSCDPQFYFYKAGTTTQITDFFGYKNINGTTGLYLRNSAGNDPYWKLASTQPVATENGWYKWTINLSELKGYNATGFETIGAIHNRGSKDVYVRNVSIDSSYNPVNDADMTWGKNNNALKDDKGNPVVVHDWAVTDTTLSFKVFDLKGVFASNNLSFASEKANESADITKDNRISNKYKINDAGQVVDSSDATKVVGTYEALTGDEIGWYKVSIQTNKCVADQPNLNLRYIRIGNESTIYVKDLTVVQKAAPYDAIVNDHGFVEIDKGMTYWSQNAFSFKTYGTKAPILGFSDGTNTSVDADGNNISASFTAKDGKVYWDTANVESEIGTYTALTGDDAGWYEWNIDLRKIPAKGTGIQTATHLWVRTPDPKFTSYMFKDIEYSLYKYTVKFGEDDAGTELAFGSDIVAPTQDPTKPATAKYTYTFDGWYDGENELGSDAKVTKDVTYVAKFTETINKYTVKFGADDKGTELEYDSSITVPTQDPTKEATVQYTYTFDGWYDGDTKLTSDTKVTKDVTYEAKFNSTVNKYTVKFGADDTGSEIEYGADIVAPANNPTQEATAQYTYTFDGWYANDVKLAEGDKVSGDVTYEARFTSTVNKYTVKFGTDDQGTLVDYGADIEAPAENPTKPEDANFTYEFDGWYVGDVKLAAGDKVSGDVTYEARFTATQKQKQEESSSSSSSQEQSSSESSSASESSSESSSQEQSSSASESSSESTSQEQSSSVSESSSESTSQEQSSSSKEESSSKKEESSSKKEESSSKQESSKVEESSKVDSSSSSEEPSNPFGCKGSASAGLLTLGGLLATMFALKKRKNSK